jgi:hypothetical protein
VSLGRGLWTCSTVLREGGDSFNISSYAVPVIMRTAKNKGPCTVLARKPQNAIFTFAPYCKDFASPHTLWRSERSWHMKHGFVAEHKIRQDIVTNRYFPTVSAQNIALLTSSGVGCCAIWNWRHSNFKRFLTIFLTVRWGMPTPQLARLAGFHGHRTIGSRTLSTVASFRLPSLHTTAILNLCSTDRYQEACQLECNRGELLHN